MIPTVPGYLLVDRVAGSDRSEVWRARDHANRPVALKILLDQREDRRIRFEAEGRLLRQLGGRHHLVACLETIRQPPTLVLELIGPASLRDLMAPPGMGGHPTPLPIDQALVAIVTAAEAVEWLHQNGVFHRDVKPSNLAMASDGTAWLIDLGVAAHGTPPRGLPEEWIEERIGSLGYAAPELLRNPSAAAPTLDVYGLAATLYEAVSGHLPFDFGPLETDADFHARIAGAEAPIPLGSRGSFPGRFAAAVDRGLAPRPEDRFQSVGALVDALSTAR